MASREHQTYVGTSTGMLGSLRDFSMSEGSTYVGLGERMSQRMAPTCDWTDMSSGEHFVQFFESDDFIVNEVSEYLIHGLKSGETCIAVATGDHLAGIKARVATFSYDLEQAIKDGRYIALDAHETLEKILSDCVPDPQKFSDVVGNLVKRAADLGGGVRIFGEMVGVLCSRGNYDSAVKLEGLWNELRKRHRFSLFCGYSMSHLQHRDATARMGEICSGHTNVLPTETYSSISSPNERLKHIAALQQRTKQLEAEIAELERRISSRQSNVDVGALMPSAA